MLQFFHIYGYFFIPVFALLLDTLIGDPRTKYHPVVGIGKIISLYEKLFYNEFDQDERKLRYGALLAISTLLTVCMITGIIVWIAGTINYWLQYVIEVIIVYISIRPRSLASAGREIANLLKDGNLPDARRKVGWIVGRDTDQLDEAEITRATIETIAENTFDGIISPLFWFILFGPVGAILYRAANTLDSMVVYKNDKYLYFGRFSARLDDVLNWVPARIGGLFFIASALVCGYEWRNAWRIGNRDAMKHPSPNGGFAEAPVAGALHIRLGGYNQYFNKMTFRAYMGDPDVAMRGFHISKTIRMMYVSTIIMVVFTMICCYGVH